MNENEPKLEPSRAPESISVEEARDSSNLKDLLLPAAVCLGAGLPAIRVSLPVTIPLAEMFVTLPPPFGMSMAVSTLIAPGVAACAAAVTAVDLLATPDKDK